jgi:hypothetical protein
MADNLIPLALLVVEGFGESLLGGPTIDALADQLGDEVTADDTGFRCVPQPVAARLFREREQARQEAAAREAKYREEIAAQGDPVLERVAAIQERHQQRREQGLLDSELSAFDAIRASATTPWHAKPAPRRST